ncbi:MAG: hypothetical protein AAGK92_13860 [Pseudomonadota bacterium]
MRAGFMTGTQTAYTSAILLFILLSSNIINLFVYEGIQSDFTHHIAFITDGVKLTYPIWHWSLIFIVELFGVALKDAAIFVTTMMCLGTFLVTAFLLRRYTDILRNRIPWYAFALSILGSVFLPGITAHMYLGVGSPSVWHNPSSYPIEFLQLVGLVFILRFYEQRTAVPLFLALSVLIISLWAKPTFVFSVVPAMFLWSLFFEKEHRWKTLTLPVLCCLCVPIPLWFQIQNLYGVENSREAGLAIAPFTIWAYYTESVVLAILRALLFPILVMTLLLRTDRTLISRFHGLAWLNLLVGMVTYIFFVETYDGEIGYDGNFAWGYYLAMTPLFVAAFIDWANAHQQISRRSTIILGSAFAVHVLFGVLYIAKLFVDRSIL